ncbi:MAG: Na(+)/H(+) antiporter subunit D, partial [Rhodospirillaceae bacterium]|nr:Na(+)/H(+) antiporter subunit D [Rhodospirillaceae bacterium]
NGVYPWLLYDMLPYPVDYAPYTWEHVLTQCQLLFFSALAFALLKQFKLYPPELPSVNLDAEWTYRWLLPRVARRGLAVLSGVVAPIRDTSVSVMAGITGLAMRWHGPSGIFARDPVISMASLAIVVVFAFVLVVHLIRGA